MPAVDLDFIQSSPAAFLAEVDDGWIPFDHLLLISEWLVDIAEGRRKRVIITVPPGYGKSTLISGGFPAWLEGAYPGHRVLLASHEAGLAQYWSAQARDMLIEHGPQFFNVSVDPDNMPKHWWHTIDATTGRQNGGYVAASGVGGSITGKRANTFIIDDPVKDAAEANSDKVRKGQQEWFKSVVRSRLLPGGAIVILMTRWHQNDLAGWLLERGMKRVKWDVLHLGLVADPKEDEIDPLGREPGEVLCPEYQSAEECEDIKEEVGSYWFSAQYQGVPGSPKGTVFKKDDFRYFKRKNVGGVMHYQLLDPEGDTRELVPVAACKLFGTMDLALSEKQTADWNVICTWALTPRRQLLLVDVYRERGDHHVRMLKGRYTKWGHAYILIESNQFQSLVVKNALRAGIPCRGVTADVDKYTRALGAQPLTEGHVVYHNVEAEWLDVYEAELIQFPRGAHDDQVDNLSVAAADLFGRKRVKITTIGGTKR